MSRISQKINIDAVSYFIFILGLCIFSLISGCLNSADSISDPYKDKFVNYYNDSRYNKLVYVLDTVNLSMEPGSISMIPNPGSDTKYWVIEGNPQARIVSLDENKIVLKSIKDGSIITFSDYKLGTGTKTSEIPYKQIHPIGLKELPAITTITPKYELNK